MKFLKTPCVLAICLGFFACEKDKSGIVQEKVEEQMAPIRKRKLAECQMALLREASKMADSILLNDARTALQDSLARSKPTQPPKPVAIAPIDSLAVAPIFPKKH